MATFILISVTNMQLTKEQLLATTGGAGLSAAFITSVIKAFTTIIEFGKMVGSSIRRGSTKNYC